mmetsp:Transcript_113637/g.157204  ORF Transcript_113637/g.157204 Transcript_113637/m.157204 type:complete len:97 (-) Transcript_113637:134-424(-)
MMGPGEDFPSSPPARIRIRGRAMATDPPDRPTFAALQRERGGDRSDLCPWSSIPMATGHRKTASLVVRAITFCRFFIYLPTPHGPLPCPTSLPAPA